MRTRLLLTGAVLLGGCATTGTLSTDGPTRAALDFEAISFEVSSWGKPLQSWRIAADGTTEFRKSETLSGFQHYRIDTRRLVLARADVARIASLLAVTQRHVGAGIACTERITDQPYGRVTWAVAGSSRQLAFDTGCLDTSARAPLEAIRAADALVAERAGGAPVVASEEVKPAG